MVRPSIDTISDIRTPAVLVDEKILRRNIADGQRRANAVGTKLVPHFKSSKSSAICLMQKHAGASGMTAATIREAEQMVSHGIDNVLVAYPQVDDEPLERLRDLHDEPGVTIRLITDTFRGAQMIRKVFGKNNLPPVLLAVDTGLGREGVRPDRLSGLETAKQVHGQLGDALVGLMTHEGHVYRAGNVDAIRAASKEAVRTMVKFKELLHSRGIGSITDISIGSSPGFKTLTDDVAARDKELMDLIGGHVTEMRPGLYVFNDAVQVALGVASFEECALSVLGSVVNKRGKKVGGTSLITNAGSKTLSSDKGPHGIGHGGYGMIWENIGVQPSGTGQGIAHVPAEDAEGREIWTPMEIVMLSEEHCKIDTVGVLQRAKLDEYGTKPHNYLGRKIGQRVRIFPMHVCPVTNLTDCMYLMNGERVKKELPVEAQGH